MTTPGHYHRLILYWTAVFYYGLNFLFSSNISSPSNLNILQLQGLQSKKMPWSDWLELPPSPPPPLPQTKKKKKGEQMFSWKYYQRTKQWDIKIIKADKGYEYIPLLIANILHARLHDVDIVTRNISLNASDPRHCWAQSIAAIPPPPTAELRKWQSRFSLPALSKSCEPEKGDI